MLFLFFLSGIAALVYQIVWTKQLALVFGVTVYATSAVVTAYMAGLALGSVVFGRWVDRWQRPLVLFGLIEGSIAVLALLFSVITSTTLKPFYVWLYGSLGDNHYVMSLARFTMTFLVLLLPTSLMGGTLPVLARAYVAQVKQLGGNIAGLYSVNNFGAFLGCVATGFVFLELFGANMTARLAALLNVTVGLLSLALSWAMSGRLAEPAEREVRKKPSAAETRGLSRPVKVALWVFGIEGLTSLVYQIAWIRLLIFFVETTIYGITSIVATYLVGLSFGAFVARPVVNRVRNMYRMLGVIEVGIGVSALVTIPLLPRMHELLESTKSTLVGWWGMAGFNIALFAVTFLVILVPTAFMGATLPVVSRIYVADMHSLGRKMGVIGCLDTVGSIMGSFIGGFVLIPFIGIQRTIIVTAVVNLALAVWVFAADPLTHNPLRRLRFATALVALLIVPLLLVLEPVPLVLYAEPGKRKKDIEILHYSEDAESSVSVIEAHGHTRKLFVNANQAAATTRRDRPSHELIAHVPLLLHPDPKRTLLLGFGIGFTSWACRVHGAEVDVVELSPGVRSANDHFTGDNNDILSDPAVHLRIDDGRNYVLGTREKYDMIQAGIIHPRLSSGNASFYSQDFYRDCKRLLTPNGVMCQWLPLHGMSHDQFKMLIRTFQTEFPHTSIWFKNSNEYCALVGTAAPLEIDFQDFERRVNEPPVRAHLSRCDVRNAYDLLDSFCLADDAVREAIGDGVLDTDDRPYIEFAVGVKNEILVVGDNIKLLTQARQPVWDRLVNVPPDRRDEVKSELARWYAGTEQLLRAYHHGQFVRAASQQMTAAYRRGLTTGPTPSPEQVYASAFARMEAAFAEALKINPADGIALFEWKYRVLERELLLADVAMATGRFEAVLEHLRNASRLLPETELGAYAGVLYSNARSALTEGR